MVFIILTLLFHSVKSDRGRWVLIRSLFVLVCACACVCVCVCVCEREREKETLFICCSAEFWVFHLEQLKRQITWIHWVQLFILQWRQQERERGGGRNVSRPCVFVRACETDHCTLTLAPRAQKYWICGTKSDEYQRRACCPFSSVAAGCRQTHGACLTRYLLFQWFTVHLSPSNDISLPSVYSRSDTRWLLQVTWASMTSVFILKARWSWKASSGEGSWYQHPSWVIQSQVVDATIQIWMPLNASWDLSLKPHVEVVWDAWGFFCCVNKNSSEVISEEPPTQLTSSDPKHNESNICLLLSVTILWFLFYQHHIMISITQSINCQNNMQINQWLNQLLSWFQGH